MAHPRKAVNYFSRQGIIQLLLYLVLLKALMLLLPQVQESVVDTLCSCITDWLDNGKVQKNKYNNRYSKAIASQNRIGWRQMFTGKISTEWLHLPNSYKANHRAVRPSYL